MDDEIVKTFSAPGVTAAVIKGFPFELAWYDPETKPGLTVLVENGKGLFLADVDSEAEGEALAAKAIRGEEVGEELLKFPFTSVTVPLEALMLPSYSRRTIIAGM